MVAGKTLAAAHVQQPKAAANDVRSEVLSFGMARQDEIYGGVGTEVGPFWRNGALVILLVPCCQGLAGSQK